MMYRLVTMIISVVFGGFYPACGTVTSVTADDVVTVQVYSGHQFAFYGDDYEVGDTVAMIMHDHGTDIVFDDEVIRAQYVIVP